MNHSVKRLRQTTLFESLMGSKRGKILDLMEPEKTKTDLNQILAAAAEKRMQNTQNQGVNKKESKVVPNTIESECCSSTKTVDSSSEASTQAFSQESDDLFPEENFNERSITDICDDIKSASFCDLEKELNKDTAHPLKSNETSVSRQPVGNSIKQISDVKLNRLPECCPSLPPLKSTETHTVMFKLPFQNGICPEPYPCNYCDKWDDDHVKMPCSPENKCPVYENGETSIQSRWELIEKSLLQDITSSYDLQEAVLQYNSQYASRWDFRGLHAFFKESLTHEENKLFFQRTLPAMVRLALQLPQICTQPIYLLKRQSNRSITFSQKQIACLLSNAFFCTYPRRNIVRKRDDQKSKNEYAFYPDINFNRLYSGTPKGGILSRKAAKLKCLLNYFSRVTSEEPTGTVTFCRQNVQPFPKWASSQKDIQNVVVNCSGVIEEEGYGMLQVDFANKYVGGGVLSAGSVQEEIRFVICPELIISRLFTECLGISEVLLISGVEQFNGYSGYADSFVWDGDFRDQTPRDLWGRRCTRIVAMDALHYHKALEQYRYALMQRELHKAFCGFYEANVDARNLPAVATGNWGCGVYKGNPHFKFLVQLIAASEIGRGMLYFTFRNAELAEQITHMCSLVSSNKIKVADVWAILCDYSSVVGSLQTSAPTFYDFFCNLFSDGTNKSRQESASCSVSNGSKQCNENSNESAATDEYTDTEPTSQNEPG